MVATRLRRTAGRLGRWWHRRGPARRDDRGDVPGWVLVTLMTAGIVTALWLVAEPKLSTLLGNALNVSGGQGR